MGCSMTLYVWGSHPSIHILFDKFQEYDRPFVAPQEPTQLSPLGRQLFRYAVQHLPEYNGLSRVKQMDIYAAASSIAHLHMDDASVVFGEDLPYLINQMMNPTFSNTSELIAFALKSMQDDARNDDGSVNIRKLGWLIDNEIGGLAKASISGDHSDERNLILLELQRIIFSLCQEDIIPRPDDTEQKSQRVWQRILDVLFYNTRISVIIGETGSEIDSVGRIENSVQIVTPNDRQSTPGKIDCKLVVSLVKAKKWSFKTISNFGMVSPMESSQQAEKLVRENMRLNHSIFKSTLPDQPFYFLEIHGYSAQLYRFMRHDSVYTCGKTLEEELILPTCMSELEWFMDGKCLSTLLELRSHFIEIAQKLQSEHTRPLKTTVNSSSPLLRPVVSRPREDQTSPLLPVRKKSRSL
ncbi:hypothetical protein BGW38_008130 [Lunasporangiospora selenospora]|uniref:Uncharacterized protein n=1 Tax=Lunasporangiospora selenospora TaxID=979761 RepID=A0A9P6KGM6_9FUNG|nr:hypothetical protein BGW38_008130 [Lunasporangiospora selenospora]